VCEICQKEFPSDQRELLDPSPSRVFWRHLHWHFLSRQQPISDVCQSLVWLAHSVWICEAWSLFPQCDSLMHVWFCVLKKEASRGFFPLILVFFFVVWIHVKCVPSVTYLSCCNKGNHAALNCPVIYFIGQFLHCGYWCGRPRYFRRRHQSNICWNL
jgi:hypothetical protein